MRLRSGERAETPPGSPRGCWPRWTGAIPARETRRSGVVLDLARGANDIRVLSRLPDVRVPGLARRTFAGYQLLLPVALWRDERTPVVDSAAHGR